MTILNLMRSFQHRMAAAVTELQPKNPPRRHGENQNQQQHLYRRDRGEKAEDTEKLAGEKPIAK